MCLVCNKTKTHVMHEGQGVAETDEQQEDPALAQEATQQAAQVETYAEGQPVNWGPIHALPPDEPYLRVETNGNITQIEMAIPDTDISLILMALLEFKERIKGEPAVEQAPFPTPKRKK